MIAPTKYVNTANSILGQAGEVLLHRRDGATVSSLWDDVRERATGISYERFVLCLDFLHVVGLVDIEGGTLRWRR